LLALRDTTLKSIQRIDPARQLLQRVDTEPAVNVLPAQVFDLAVNHGIFLLA